MLLPTSSELPVKNVEYNNCLPSLLIFRKNASSSPNPPFSDIAPIVVGKSEELVVPVIYELPSRSTAIAYAWSKAEPPITIANICFCPVESYLAIKISLAPLNGVIYAPIETGKSLDVVSPVIYIFLLVSKAIAFADSFSDPPINMAYSNEIISFCSFLFCESIDNEKECESVLLSINGI